MDLSAVHSRVAQEVAESPWSAGSGSTGAGPAASFADHLQPDPDSADDASRPPAGDETPGDPPTRTEDHDRAGTADDTVAPAATAVAANEPAAPPAFESESGPARHPPADDSAGTADKSGPPHAPAGNPQAAAGPQTLLPGHATTAQTTDPVAGGAASSRPAKPSTAAPVVNPAHSDQAQAPSRPTTEFAAATGTVADPAVAAEELAATSPAAAATEKPAGKVKSEKSSTPARSASLPSHDGTMVTELAANRQSAPSFASRVGFPAQLADSPATDQTAGDQNAERIATAGAQDADIRTPGNERAHALAERLPEQLLARGGSGPHAAPELTQADQLRLIQRVARAMEAAPQRGGLLRLRLRPPELGSLRLEVVLRDGNLSARIETETQAAKVLLLEQFPQLRERLAEHGFRVAQFDVDVSDQHSGGTPAESHDSADALPPPPTRRRDTTALPPAGEVAPSASPLAHVQPGKLNVVI